jgi:hypothetical protein
MSHYAKINNNNIVINIIVAEKDFIDTLDDKEYWIQTSYNTRGGIHYSPETNLPDSGIPLRKNYAGIGYLYDKDLDAFIPPKPFESWLLDKETCLWIPPIEMPKDGNIYQWNESTKNWIKSDLK